MANKRTFVHENFNISYEETKKGWSMPFSHQHTHYEIYVLLSGERTVTIGTVSYHVTSGFACLFEGNAFHRSEGSTDYSGICIHFSKKYLEKYFQPGVVSSYLSCFQSPIVYIPKAYREKLLSWSDAINQAPVADYLLLAQILTDFSQFQKQSCVDSCLTPDKTKPFGAQRIIRYIDANYAILKTVKEIARACGVSESYLHRTVKKHTNLTVKEYINTLRLRHAVHEINCSCKSLAIISKSCGFQNISYFYHLFKKKYGVTPAQYREQRKNMT